MALKGTRAPAPCGRNSFSSGSTHPRSSGVTPEALEEARRNVWLVLKAHGWEPEQEIDKDIAQMLMVLAKMGVTDTRELLRLTLEHFELARLN